MKQVTDDSFEKDVLKAEKPVLVDFWAEWCGPCRTLAPLLDELSAEMGETLEITKINIDENPLTPGKYGVRGIPTLMLFHNGQLTATKVGAPPMKSVLQDWIKTSMPK
ncbi:thioredoxin [Haematospirillum jordaniae]|uniref:Thioredoxin n=1 Tax=Haematospirillum jordaniae TaxID=1549855 RepID=A0A143DCK2_9PROT|nr:MULTISPECIES: thioredoxin [Haematospirillum]AMW34471.1 thioredoxin [Haematospirillum jordaniae]NKD44985.1 thioredoxin [Haematospirillum jordaniae]NKD57818.1 thioredoxin [Haematospirillum jordaniae]NKD59779.1 thioredoxin [Haematospirillum jordaniae]NKD67646.1 thioredoxin [Haematospirillum jordaniae]